ncbi:NAD-dependent epimerase/dehydratase family protein [Candidatus Woesearchaeota archaeon]|jgi:UDP-glucose 4-epimerase|nr:NAD-dependent epimerase/dehydratase family protein [Candidatus Woesearchaeota archaeon]
MKILVTGGAGFIGSHVVDLLIENNHEVTIIDDLSTGLAEHINPKADFFEKSITDPEIINIFKNKHIEILIHHAAQVDVRKSILEPALDAEINIIGSINLFDCCRKTGVKKIILASSCGVYGNPKYLPCDEEHPINPLSNYAISKYAIELFLRQMAQLNKIDHTILRYANVYGPRQSIKGEAGVVSIFIKKMLNIQACKIFGDGDQTRDLVYVKDVAHANLLAISSNVKLANIGTQHSISIMKLHNKLQKISETDMNPIFEPSIEGEIKDSVLTKIIAKEQLNWEPTIKIEEGLKKTFDWFKNKAK